MTDRSRSPDFIRLTDRQRLGESHYAERKRDAFTSRGLRPSLHRVFLLTVLGTVFHQIARARDFRRVEKSSV